MQSGPGDVNVQLVDVARHEGEGQAQLAFQHVQAEIEVTEHGVATPKGDLELSD